MQLLGYNIPKSFYLVNSTNDSILITINNVNTVITLPHGNYARVQLCKKLYDLIKPLLLIDTQFVCSYDKDVENGKIFFAM